MAVKTYIKGGTQVRTYEQSGAVDLNLTAQRSRLREGSSSVLLGLDNTRPGIMRSANPRKPLSVSSPDDADIVFAQGSDISGRYTDVQADEFDTTDYFATANPATELVISAVGIGKGIIFNQDMVGGVLILDNDGSELFHHKIATVTNDTLTFDRASAVQFSDGNTFAILWEKEHDKRGVWLSDGRRIYLVQNDAVDKYLDLGTDNALGTLWHGSRISHGVFLFVNPKYAPRVIVLDAAAAEASENLAQLAGLSLPEAENDRVVHASTITDVTGGDIDDTGIYRVRIRFVDQRSGAVSRFVQIHATTAIGSDDFVSITETSRKVLLTLQAVTYADRDNIPNVARATHIQIYRTIEDGVSYFLERNLPISRDGNWIENGAVDLKLSNAALINRPPLNPLEESAGGLPPIGRKVTSIAGVTIIAGKADDAHVDPVLLSDKAATTPGENHQHEIEWPTVEDDNTVYPSSLIGFFPESFNPSDKRRLSDIGDDFQNFGTAGNVAVAVMREGAYRLRIDGAGLFKTTIGERGIGTPWPESVVSVGKFVMWASPRGIIAYDTLFDRETGGYQYVVSKSGESLEKWLSEAYRLGDIVYCGYDARDDILRVRRVANLGTPYSSVQINDILKWTGGGNVDAALIISDATSSSLEWSPAVDAALAEGDTLVVLPGASPVATGDFESDGDVTRKTSIESAVSTPFAGTGVGDFIVFTSGANNNQVRRVDTQTSSKLTWTNPLISAPIDTDMVITANNTPSLISGPMRLHFNQLVAATEWGLQGNGFTGDDPSGGTDVYVALSDGATGVVAATVSGTVQAGGAKIVKLQFSGLSTLKVNDVIRINTTSGVDSFAMTVLAYTDSNSVTTTGSINLSPADPLVITLTQAFIDQLAGLGSDQFAIRVVNQNSSGLTRFAEVDSVNAFGLYGQVVGVTKTSITAHENNDWSGVAVDDIVYFSSGVNAQQARRVSTVSASVITWLDPLPTLPDEGNSFDVYADTTVDSYTVTQALWTLGVTGVTAPSGTPFASISAGDVIALTDESPVLARVISAVTAGNQIAWVAALLQPPDIGDNWKIIDKDAGIVSDTVEEEKMVLSTTSIEIFEGLARVLQFSFKLKTWVEFDNDPGINYVQSVFAGAAVLQAPALYSPSKLGSLFEVNNRDLVHPYDAYTVSEQLAAANYNISSTTIEIKSPSTSRQFRAEMLGDTVRIVSSDSRRNGKVRMIAAVDIGSTHKITFEPAILGLDVADTFVIGGNHFKMRLAPYLGADYANVKTIHGLVLHATPTERHGGNSRWPDPPDGKLTLRAYRNLGNTPVDSKEDVFIFDEDDVTRISEDRYSALECQGNAIELEIESAGARTDFQIEHLSCDVAEDAVETEDASESA